VRILLVAILIAFLPVSARAGNTAPAGTPSPIPSRSTQLIVVRSTAWWAAFATLERYERDQASSWRRVGAPVPVNLGRSGMGWGRGLQAGKLVGPQKREGDGRSPAGVFRLANAFGSAGQLPAGAHGFPYVQSRSTSYCVEDTRSSHYNQIVDSALVKPSAWEQWSEMLRPDGLFDWGIVVLQNAPDTQKFAGSCVFLHIWRGPHRPTAGCTSMHEHELEEVITWLEPGREPLLVQLPEPVLAANRDAWGLP
jgi:L,D-peptidoglycan transpeptidase YkuD (ErfK/YbiS/YcfS/YnhG family)